MLFTDMIGKIDKQGAENQALHSVTDEVGFPTLRLVATGDIRLETLSWIEAIRRRHITGGLDMPDIPLGKRAAAFQKLLKSQEESANAAVVAESTSSLPPITNPEYLYKEESATKTVSINSSVVPSCDIVGEHESNTTVSLNLDNIPGMQTEGEKYLIMFTCNVCETRSARKISKRGYHHGVVICRCEKCRNLHLIADRMGVFEDESWDIQQHMTKILDKQNVSVSHEADVLEVTFDEEGEGEGEEEESDEEEASNGDHLDLTQFQKDIERELGPGPIK